MKSKKDEMESIITNMLIEIDRVKACENLSSLQQQQLCNAANCAEALLHIVLNS